ncbi:low temperature requirement protein A [Baekduia sp. Peel2402]|uniref:low temperature requirement protein A n=1 Tax=Baekduia sp. Peel2402 TaxID=3458296 RepID=UPI00403E647B
MTETAAPAAHAASGPRVTTLELFFDLVFVFTITQLSTVLAADLSWAGAGHVALMLTIIFYMYGGYAWLTNNLDMSVPVNRVFLLGGMCAYFVIALSIPSAFDGSGLAFALGYAAVVAIHLWLYAHASPAGFWTIVRQLAPGNLLGALLVLIGGAMGGDAEIALWIAAALVSWIVPRLLVDFTAISVAADHFVERHGLVVIVAIGESLIAIGIGAEELPVDAELILVALLGLLLSAALWWTYFGGDDERAVHALDAMTPARRGQAALEGFGYAHLVLLLAIVFVAVGLKKATGHAYDTLEDGQALVLSGGVALFLAADVGFRHVLGLGFGPRRLVCALAALVAWVAGVEVAAIAQVALLVVIVGVASYERGPTAKGSVS